VFQVISQVPVQFNFVHLGPLLQWTHHQDIILWEPCFTTSVCNVTCMICLSGKSVVLGTTLGNTISEKQGFTGHNSFIWLWNTVTFVLWDVTWLCGVNNQGKCPQINFFCLPTYYLECTTKLKAVCSVSDNVVNGTKFSSTVDVSTLFHFSTLS